MSVLFIAVICISATFIYVSIGLGVSKMISKLNNTPAIDFVHLVAWPISCVIYALMDEVS